MKTIDESIRFSPDLTGQQIFDLAVHHLGTMPCRSVETSGQSCMYRGPNNNSCAVGYFISDEEYTEKMEGYGLHTLIERGLCPNRLGKHRDLFRALQRVHDIEEHWDDNRLHMKAQLIIVGQGFKYDTSVLNNPEYAWNIGGK